MSENIKKSKFSQVCEGIGLIAVFGVIGSILPTWALMPAMIACGCLGLALYIF